MILINRWSKIILRRIRWWILWRVTRWSVMMNNNLMSWMMLFNNNNFSWLLISLFNNNSTSIIIANDDAYNDANQKAANASSSSANINCTRSRIGVSVGVGCRSNINVCSCGWFSIVNICSSWFIGRGRWFISRC